MGVAKGGSRRCIPRSPLFLDGGGLDLDRGALAAEVGGLKLVGLFLTIAHHLSRHHLVMSCCYKKADGVWARISPWSPLKSR